MPDDTMPDDPVITGCSIRIRRSAGRSCATCSTRRPTRSRPSARKVAREGWGARILDAQRPDGSWGGGANFPEWIGHQADARRAAPARARAQPTRASRRPSTRSARTSAGSTTTCPSSTARSSRASTAPLVALADRLRPGRPVRIVDRLLGEQMEDGGWNCEQEHGSVRGSSDTTINVLEGLLEYERATGGSTAITDGPDAWRGVPARSPAAPPASRPASSWTTSSRSLHFPPRWHYDVLRGLDYLRDAGVEPDERVDEAIELLRSKRDADGRWPLEATYPGEANFEMDEGDGQPSRWNTLRALRVLRWYDAARGGRGRGGRRRDRRVLTHSTTISAHHTEGETPPWRAHRSSWSRASGSGHGPGTRSRTCSAPTATTSRP